MIARVTGGAIIMAGSGMCEAGRIRHHLKNNLWRSDATVMLVGYQARGTLGALLAQGAENVKIMGESIKVGAAIRQMDMYSGHADGPDLIKWVKARLPVKSAIFLTHGEEKSLAALRQDLVDTGVPADRIVVPQLDDVIDLTDGDGKVRFRKKPRRLTHEVVRELDWHNDLADFTLRLREALDAAADDKRRKTILRRVKRALEGGGQR